MKENKEPTVAETKALVGLSPADAKAIEANCNVQIQLAVPSAPSASDDDAHPAIDFKEVLRQSFAAGLGVVTLSANMTDAQILALIKSACAGSEGKAVKVVQLPKP